MNRIMGAPNELKVVNIRLVKEPSLYSDVPIQTPQDVLQVVARELATYDREVFAVLNMKSNGQVINLNICSVGTLDSAMTEPREIFKSAILSNAKYFLAVHNHPGSTLEPSLEDLMTTRRLQECGEILGIPMRDHIIVAGETGEMFSFREAGLMDRDDQERRSLRRSDWELER